MYIAQSLWLVCLLLCSPALGEEQSRHMAQQIPLMRTSFQECAQYADSEAAMKKYNWTMVNFTYGYREYIYSQTDIEILSDNVLRTGVWEEKLSDEISYALQQVEAESKARQDTAVLRPALLDVGANIGYFSMFYAARGYRVFSFEALQRNARLLHSSLCLNPKFADQVTLVNTGLGSEKKQCYIVVSSISISNGGLECGESMEEVRARVAATDLITGNIPVDSLDSVLHKLHLGGLSPFSNMAFVMKIDTEGSELEIMRGAAKILETGLVWYITSEFSSAFIGAKSGDKDEGRRYIHFVYGLGYEISNQSFKGPNIQPSQIDYDAIDPVNLYFTLKPSRRRPKATSKSRSRKELA